MLKLYILSIELWGIIITKIIKITLIIIINIIFTVAILLKLFAILTNII